MNWRKDPRVEKLLEKATVESLMKIYFQRVYGKEEVQNMENGLKNCLKKYPRKEEMYEKLYDENDENEALPLLNECLDALCQKKLSRAKSHTPQTLLTLARLFVQVGDYRLACEVIWCSISLSMQDFIQTRGLKVDLHSHNGKRRFARALSLEIEKMFGIFESCHSSFYTNSHDKDDVNSALHFANEFLNLLQNYELTIEKKNSLEMKQYDW